MSVFHRTLLEIATMALVLANAWCVAAEAQFEPPYGSMGDNRSAAYARQMQNHDVSLPDVGIAANAFFVIFVPGLISDSNIRSSKYFYDFEKVLAHHGMSEERDYALLSKKHGFDSENSVALNAKALSNFIRKVDRPVVLVTHSKGSVDALAALVANEDFPEITSHIHGWLNIQGSIWGTPIADAIEVSGVAKFLVDLGLALFGGSGQALTDMTLVSRHQFMNDHWDEVMQLSETIRILSFVSSKEYEHMDRSIKALYEAPFIGPAVTGAMKDQVHDGLVPVSHALLPGSAYVIAVGIDHADSVTNTDRDQYRFNRLQMSSVLLRLLLE
jgi:hypothetical protein